MTDIVSQYVHRFKKPQEVHCAICGILLRNVPSFLHDSHITCVACTHLEAIDIDISLHISTNDKIKGVA